MDPKYISDVETVETVILKPSQLTKDYVRHIETELKNMFLNTHNKNGFIVDLKIRGVDKQGVIAVYTGNVSFTVFVTFSMFIPQLNCVYPAVVKTLIKNKIFVQIFGMLDAMIISDAKTLPQPETTVNVELISVPYSQMKFNCLAQLVA